MFGLAQKMTIYVKIKEEDTKIKDEKEFEKKYKNVFKYNV